ncbi:hypothetical protein C3B79_0996 [Aeromonas hydrophila]|nr:hypothetical protein C3B79_0996 [Aeromonas hydrophila]
MVQDYHGNLEAVTEGGDTQRRGGRFTAGQKERAGCPLLR